MKYLVYRRNYGNSETTFDPFYDVLVAEFCEKSDASLFIEIKGKNDSWAISHGYISYVLIDNDNID